MSRSPASRQVEVCISVMTIMQQFLGQAQKKTHISWILAGETMFETGPIFSGVGLGEPRVPDEALASCVPLQVL